MADQTPTSTKRAGWLVAAGVVVALGALYFGKLRPDDQAEERRRLEVEARLRAEADAKVVTEQQGELAKRRAALDAQLGKMVLIPASTFRIGSEEHDNDEKPMTKVTVPAFEIDLREVSLISYAACLKLGKCTPSGTGERCNGGREDRAAHPVNCVDQAQAAAFCAWAGKRLPREEEWELAARGTDERLYPWGSTPPDDEACWKRGTEGTCVVGEKAAQSPFGLADVAGNVREWTASPFCPYTRRDCDASSKVVRGSAFSDSEADALRASARTKTAPDVRSPEVGFRCVRDALE